MADVKFEVVQFALSTAAAGNTQDVTISGFGAASTIKAVIFIGQSGTVAGTIAAHARAAIGFTDGTIEAALDSYSEDAVGTANTGRGHRSDCCISLTSTSDASLTRFSFNSFITDGIRLDIDLAATAAHLFTAIIIGGADVTNAHVTAIDDFTNGTSAVAITGSGFTPDMVFLATTGDSSVFPNHAANAICTFGCAINDGAASQRVSMIGSRDQRTTADCYSYIGNDSVVGRVYANSLTWDAVLTSFDANGFTVTPNAAPGRATGISLELKFQNTPDFDLFDMSWPTSGNYAETTPNFEPNFGLIVTNLGPTSRNAIAATTDWSWSFAAFDASSISVVGASDDDGPTTIVAKSLASTSLEILKGDGTAKDIVASTYAFDSLGWDFTITTNPGATGLGWGLAVGVGTTAQSITVGQVTESETLFSPTALADQSIAVGLVTESETLFSPAVIFGQSIAVGLLTESETLFSPAVIQATVVAVNQLTESETLFSPAVIFGQSIAVGLLTESETLFSPAVLPGPVSIAVGLLTESESLFSPAVSQATVIAVNQVTESDEIFSPIPIFGQSIAVGLVTESETLFTPAVLPGPVSIAVGLLTESETLFSSTPVQGALIAVGLVTESETLFSPTPIAAQSISVGQVTESETLFSSTPTPGAVSISVGLVTESESLFSPAVSQATLIAVGLVAEIEALFPSAAIVPQSLTVGLLTELEALFASNVIGGGQINVGIFHVVNFDSAIYKVLSDPLIHVIRRE